MDVSAFRGFRYDDRGWIHSDVEFDMMCAGCCVNALIVLEQDGQGSAQRVWGGFASTQHTFTSCKRIELD